MRKKPVSYISVVVIKLNPNRHKTAMNHGHASLIQVREDTKRCHCALPA